MRKAITTLWVVVAALMSFGLVLVYSASSTELGGAFPYLKKQLIAGVIGVVCSVVLYRTDYRKFFDVRIVAPLLVLSLALCSLVFLFPKVNGSRRWINLPGFSLQPSEFARVAVVVVLSAWYAYSGSVAHVIKKTSVHRSRFVRWVVNAFLAGRDEFIIPFALLALLVAPIVLSPDLGATGIIFLTAGAIVVLAGVKWRYIMVAVVAAMVIFTVFMMTSANRRDRVLSFIEDKVGEGSTRETGYQGRQSLESFYRGGVQGVGCGQSIQKYRYLTEQNNDFIFAIVAEEFGLVGTSAIVVGFIILACCGFYIAYHAVDQFGRYLSFGLTFLIVFEGCFNVGMATGSLPSKGLALPFISYGGSSLIATLICVGLIAGVGATTLKNIDNVNAVGKLQEW